MVTADLAGAAMRHVEEQYGEETVAVFLIGAAGDQPLPDRLPASAGQAR